MASGSGNQRSIQLSYAGSPAFYFSLQLNVNKVVIWAQKGAPRKCEAVPRSGACSIFWGGAQKQADAEERGSAETRSKVEACFWVVRPEGFEPPTPGSEDQCSKSAEL